MYAEIKEAEEEGEKGGEDGDGDGEEDVGVDEEKEGDGDGDEDEGKKQLDECRNGRGDRGRRCLDCSMKSDRR